MRAQNCFVSKTISIMLQYKISSHCSKTDMNSVYICRFKVKKVISSQFSDRALPSPVVQGQIQVGFGGFGRTPLWPKTTPLI